MKKNLNRAIHLVMAGMIFEREKIITRVCNTIENHHFAKYHNHDFVDLKSGMSRDDDECSCGCGCGCKSDKESEEGGMVKMTTCCVCGRDIYDQEGGGSHHHHHHHHRHNGTDSSDEMCRMGGGMYGMGKMMKMQGMQGMQGMMSGMEKPHAKIMEQLDGIAKSIEELNLAIDKHLEDRGVDVDKPTTPINSETAYKSTTTTAK